MLSTLFFDEAYATSALHVRATRQYHVEDEERQEVSAAFLASQKTVDCFNGGSIPIPSLRATLLWWLDREAPLVHLILTSSSPGDVSYSCRKMSVEVPAIHQTIIACGVTHVQGETVLAITWVTSLLEVGLLRLQLQRNSDHQSHLLLVPDGKAVLTSRISGVMEAFESERDTFISDNEKNVNRDGEENFGIGSSLSACIISSLPSVKAANGVLSMIFLTNGISLWSVEMGEHGVVAENEFRDPEGNSCSTAGSLGSFEGSFWFLKWPWSGKRGKGNWCLTLNAVQQTQYILLLRSNGLLELYDGSMESLIPISSCALSRDEFVSYSTIHQWSVLLNNHVHVVTYFRNKESHRCVWTRLPVYTIDEGFQYAETMSIIPPISTTALMGCAAVSDSRLTLLWEVTAEGDSSTSFPISIGSLLHTTQQGISGMLQNIIAREEDESEITRATIEAAAVAAATVSTAETENEKGHRGLAPVIRMSIEGAEVYFCHSQPLHALLFVGDELVLIEKANEKIRAHVLSNDMTPLEKLVESSFAVGRPVLAYTCNSLPFLAMHLIPAVVRDESRLSCRDSLAFEEGVEVAGSCVDGADNLAALLINTLESVPIAFTLGGFQILSSAAHLQGYTPSGFVDDAAMMIAISNAAACMETPSRHDSFCSFSRHFVQHTVLRDLVSRVTYLVCSYIGWMCSGLSYTTSLESPRVRVVLEFLSAAYHAVTVAGPHVASLAPNVSETLISDVLELLLQFEPQHGEEGGDALFAVTMAKRLQSCDESIGMRACVTWCNLLSRRYPCLQHFRILRDLGASRTTCFSHFLTMSLAASFHLASLPATIALQVLFDNGLDIFNGLFVHTAFGHVHVEDWKALLGNTTLIAKVYRVSLLRRVIYPGGGYHACVSGSLVRELFLTELVELEQYVRLEGDKYTRIHRALVELQLETYLFLARASLDELNPGDVFRSLEEVLQSAAELKKNPMYTEHVVSILGEVAELASTSQELTEALVTLTHSNTELDGILATKWYYACVARLPTKMTSTEVGVVRLRAANGLFRFLCKRHAYGQAGRMMTDLANAIRRSALRSKDVEAVIEMTSLALTAVGLIAPDVPLQIQEEERELSVVSVYGPAAYPHTSEQTTSNGPLDRSYLPWLRRRHFQAYCEKKLMDANRHVDCADLWTENPPIDAYKAAVKRFVEALVESRFWPEARRFALMTGYDISLVLQEHVLDLMSTTDYRTDKEALEEWVDVTEGCKESSSLSNQFTPFRRTVVTALSFGFTKAHPALLGTLEKLDRYAAMRALLEVFETLLYKQSVTTRANALMNEETEEASPSLLSDTSSNTNINVSQPWLPLVEALRIGSDVLRGSMPDHRDEFHMSEASMTAGIFDTLACRARELLDSPTLLAQLKDAQAERIANVFLELFDDLKQLKWTNGAVN